MAGDAGSWCAVVDGHGVGTVSGVELLHEIVDVTPDGLVAYVELECDLLICVALRYVSDYLKLSRC